MATRWSYRRTGLMFVLLLLASGCATNGVVDTSAASIPAPSWRLGGTWQGSAYEVGTASPIYNSHMVVRFNEDGTWTAVETARGGRVVEYTGTATVRGDRVIMEESTGRRWVTLRRSGNRLYGVENIRASGADAGRVMIELTRTE